MPLVQHSTLPTFDRLRAEGYEVLPEGRANQQDIRELHVGLFNMMPDAAMEATERQFYRLIGASNQIAQFHIHPFSPPSIARGRKAAAHIQEHYESFSDIERDGLDALIITGANPRCADMREEPFWASLVEVMDWAAENVTSVMCSCLATHAHLLHRYGIERQALSSKRWGVYKHRLSATKHPLSQTLNDEFYAAHSRINDISEASMREAGLQVLASSAEAGVHLATSEDGFRFVYLQGHPEYDTFSLLKEYKREVMLWFSGGRDSYPPFVAGYFSLQGQAILTEYQHRAQLAKKNTLPAPDFPEALLQSCIVNTWRDTSKALMSNWIGLWYQITNVERDKPFMAGVDKHAPLAFLRDK